MVYNLYMISISVFFYCLTFRINDNHQFPRSSDYNYLEFDSLKEVRISKLIWFFVQIYLLRRFHKKTI